ncbi:P-loop containing nucleoside triphosphate hydrolase protein, partial [Ephemerocybe angulata]
PDVSADVVKQLEACGVRTDSELLFEPLFELYQRLPLNSITLQELSRVYTVVTELSAAEPILASDLLKYEEEKHPLEQDAELRVGDEQIDELLRGLGGARLVEISGDRKMGKSTLAFNIAINHLLSRVNESVAWVDTLGSFAPSTVLGIIFALGRKDTLSVMRRLHVSLAFDAETLHAVLDELFDSDSGARPRILVIDAITPLLTGIMSPFSSHGHAILADLMQRLRSIASQYHTTILIINDATVVNLLNVEDAKRERKPALGPTFTFMTDTTLWLSPPKAGEEGEDVDAAQTECDYLTIIKSRNKVSSQSSLSLLLFHTQGFVS